MASEVRSELRPGQAVLVSGESGVGKSVLVSGELGAAAAEDPAAYDVVYLNLRLLPPTMAALRDALGAPLEKLLAEMSAPTRVLVLDAADIMIERDDPLLAQLLRAARAADVTTWVVSATDGRAAVRTVLEETVGAVRELDIGGLDDGELEEVASAFPQLRRLVDEPRAKELLRRPAVIDLFVRSGSEGLPLSDADAFLIVWTRLVRNNEREVRGFPEARDQVMRQLGTQQLRQTDAAATYASLEPGAVAGLQHDVLLGPSDRWQPLPRFAHELLRTYAVARVLISLEDLVAELIAQAAPRWALPAARLAVQVLLSAPDTPQTPLEGRFTRLQTSVDRLPCSGHGDRWADLPTEAVLSLPNAGAILADVWPALVSGDAEGLRRLLELYPDVVDEGLREGGGVPSRTAEI
jgi:energy-coupling factor transporter ATP-binding protein EcfA2